MKETPTNVFQLGNGATTNGLNTASVPFLHTIVFTLFTSRAGNDAMIKCCKRWSLMDRLMTAIVGGTVSSLLSIRPAAGIIKEHVV